MICNTNHQNQNMNGVQKYARTIKRTDNHKKGFLLVEILFSFALFTYFISRIYSIGSIIIPTYNFFERVQWLFTSVSAGKYVAPENIYKPPFADIKMCDSFYSTLDTQIQNQYSNQYNNQVSFDLHDFLTIDTVSSEDLQFGTSTIITSIKPFAENFIFTLNSSVQSDPDVARLNITQFEKDAGYVYGIPYYVPEGSVLLKDLSKYVTQKVNSGPGIVDASIFGTNLYLANTSSLSSMQVFSLENNGLQKIQDCQVHPKQTDTLYAKTITNALGVVLLGFDKNTGPELYAVNPKDCVVIETLETNYGITRLKYIDPILYILGPADPELVGYTVFVSSSTHSFSTKNFESDSTSLVHFTRSLFYDAEGLSGNGRSLDFTTGEIVFGRSRGNKELNYVLLPDIQSVIGNSDGLFNLPVHAQYQILASIDSIISGNEYTLLLTSDSSKTVQLFKRDKQSSKAVLLGYLKLPARGTDMICYNNSLYVSTVSTTTALIKISPK